MYVQHAADGIKLSHSLSGIFDGVATVPTMRMFFPFQFFLLLKNRCWGVFIFIQRAVCIRQHRHRLVVGWFDRRKNLRQQHLCNTRIDWMHACWLQRDGFGRSCLRGGKHPAVDLFFKMQLNFRGYEIKRKREEELEYDHEIRNVFLRKCMANDFTFAAYRRRSSLTPSSERHAPTSSLVLHWADAWRRMLIVSAAVSFARVSCAQPSECWIFSY